MEKSILTQMTAVYEAWQFYVFSHDDCKKRKNFFNLIRHHLLAIKRVAFFLKSLKLQYLGYLAALVSLTSCSSFSFSSPHQEGAITRASEKSFHTALWEDSPTMTWYKLQHTSSANLAALQANETDPVKTAWLNLALMSKKQSTNTQALARELITWREQNPAHPANQLLPAKEILTQLQTFAPPRQIAILLPQTGSYGAAGQSVREGFLNAYYANLSKGGTPKVKIYDTGQSDLASVYKQAISEGADFVVGPLTKEDVQQLHSIPLNTPTLALNYSDERKSLPPNLYQYGLLPEDEAAVIAERARKAGLAHAIVIAPQSMWGKRMVSAFTNRWQAIGGDIQEKWYFNAGTNFHQEIAHLLNVNIGEDKKLMQTDNNKLTLEQQRRHDFDVIFLFAQPQTARVIVPLLRYYYASDIPVYATSAVYSGKPNPVKDVDLNGVIICDIPWNLHAQQKTKISSGTQSERLYAVGQDAYMLSQTLERLKQLPNFPIYGTTGSLTISSNRQIHRRLPCITIRNGLL